MSNSNNKLKKKSSPKKKVLFYESINNASYMNQNKTLSPSSIKKDNVNEGDNISENLMKKFESATNLKNNKTPSPIKKKTKSESSTNSDIPPRISPLSPTLPSSIASGVNISFSSPIKSKSKSKSSSVKTSPLKYSIRSGSFPKPNNSGGFSFDNSFIEGQRKILKKLYTKINNLKKKFNTQGMPVSVYNREIRKLKKELSNVENFLKSENNRQKMYLNTQKNNNKSSSNTSGSSLRSYTSQEVSVEKGRNKLSPLTPMSINKSKSSAISMMNHNVSMADSTKSKSGNKKYASPSMNMSRVVNTNANENSRAALDAPSLKKKSH